MFLATILYGTFADPGLMDSSDYVSSFYVAGRLVADPESSIDCIPGLTLFLFRDSPFNDSAHQLLSRLAPRTITSFMYPPIVAWIFAPLSVVPPHVSLLLWQVISVAALGLACRLLSRTSDVRAHDLFFLSVLFFPTFITVVIGQAGILFGLLPLSIGYWLLSRGSPLAAGFAWAALALKPQFLAVAGIISMAYALTGRIRVLSGMILGLCAWLSLNFFLVPEGMFAAWIQSLRQTDDIFSSDEYRVPVRTAGEPSCGRDDAVSSRSPRVAEARALRPLRQSGIVRLVAVSKDSAVAPTGGTGPACGVRHQPGHTPAHLAASALLRPRHPLSHGADPVGQTMESASS